MKYIASYVRDRGDGRWQAQLKYKDAEGRDRFISQTSVTLAVRGTPRLWQKVGDMKRISGRRVKWTRRESIPPGPLASTCRSTSTRSGSPGASSTPPSWATAPRSRTSGAPPSHYRRSGTGPRRRRISIEGFGSPMGVRPLRGDRRAAQAAVTMPMWGQRSSPWSHPPRGFRSPACRRTALLAAR